MKVLIDCRSINPDESGGIDTFVNILIISLAKCGVQVVVDVCSKHQDWYENYYSNFQSITIISDPLYPYLLRLFNKSCLTRFVHKIVNHMSSSFGLKFPQRRRRGWAKKQIADVVYYPYHKDRPQHFHLPIVSIIHAILPNYGKNEMEAISLHVKWARILTVCWPYPFKDLTNRYPCVANRLLMVPITTKQNICSQTQFDCTHLGLETDFLFYPAFLTERKNHENLIKAYAIARNINYDLPMVVFTGGGNHELRDKLNNLSIELGVSQKFKFLGNVTRDLMSTLYKGCLGTISSSFWEAGMITFQEGGYYGKPCACSDIPPARDHAKLLGLDVCFFDPNNPRDIADKLAYFVKFIDKYRGSAVKSSEFIKLMDEKYLGECYVDIFSYAAGLSDYPAWAPYKAPQTFLQKELNT